MVCKFVGQNKGEVEANDDRLEEPSHAVDQLHLHVALPGRLFPHLLHDGQQPVLGEWRRQSQLYDELNTLLLDCSIPELRYLPELLQNALQKGAGYRSDNRRSLGGDIRLPQELLLNRLHWDLSLHPRITTLSLAQICQTA